MSNSIGLCHPLCLPFVCREVETRCGAFPKESCKHYFLEMLHLREGEMEVTLEKERYTVSQGDVVIVCPGVRHQFAGAEDTVIRADLIQVDPDRLPGHLIYSPRLKMILQEAWKSRLPMVISAQDAEALALPEMCGLCVQEQQRRSFGYDLSMASRLSLIFLGLVRFWMERGLEIHTSAAPEEPINALSEYIQQHLQDNLRVEDLAAWCHLSYPWFARKFREIYGVSCKDYIEQMRVAQVEQYLLFTDMDLAKISEKTGYADCSHMIKNFKRLMDITPGQYRLKHRQKAAV